MQTIKIIGSGPLAGQTAYGSEKNISLSFKKGVGIQFYDMLMIGDRAVEVCEFSIETGCAMIGEECETDLLMVDPHDLSLLRNMYWRWMGEFAVVKIGIGDFIDC